MGNKFIAITSQWKVFLATEEINAVKGIILALLHKML